MIVYGSAYQEGFLEAHNVPLEVEVHSGQVYDAWFVDLPIDFDGKALSWPGGASLVLNESDRNRLTQVLG